MHDVEYLLTKATENIHRLTLEVKKRDSRIKRQEQTISDLKGRIREYEQRVTINNEENPKSILKKVSFNL